MKILASKQVGDVSYLVAEIETLYNIVRDEIILSSRVPEKDPNTGKPEHYISLSRNYTSAALRNNGRWRYGVLLDGNKLSERYHIEPISFYGGVRKGVRLNTLTKYDDGTCYALLINGGGSMQIPSSLYDSIEQIIINLPEETKQQKRLIVQTGGKRRYRGRMIDTKYTFKNPNGFPLNENTLGSQFTNLLKHTDLNETEERIWVQNKKSISISGCIIGLVLPKSEADRLDEPDGVFAMLRQEMDSLNPSGWDLVTY